MLGTNQNQQMQDMMNQLMPKRKVEREVPVKTNVRFWPMILPMN